MKTFLRTVISPCITERCASSLPGTNSPQSSFSLYYTTIPMLWDKLWIRSTQTHCCLVVWPADLGNFSQWTWVIQKEFVLFGLQSEINLCTREPHLPMVSPMNSLKLYLQRYLYNNAPVEILSVEMWHFGVGRSFK